MFIIFYASLPLQRDLRFSVDRAHHCVITFCIHMQWLWLSIEKIKYACMHRGPHVEICPFAIQFFGHIYN